MCCFICAAVTPTPTPLQTPSIFHTAAAVALLLTLLLDNTIPGSDEERGLQHMMCLVKGSEGGSGDKPVQDWWEDDHMNRVRG